MSSAALPIEASCALKVGLTKVPAQPAFLAPIFSDSFLPAAPGGVLEAAEWLEVVLVSGVDVGL